MFRVINHDLNDEVMLETESQDEALKCQEDNYFFMTGIQEFSDGSWINIDGMHEKLSDCISKALNLNSEVRLN